MGTKAKMGLGGVLLALAAGTAGWFGGSNTSTPQQADLSGYVSTQEADQQKIAALEAARKPLESKISKLEKDLAAAPKQTDLDKAVAKVAELEGKLKEAPTAAELKAAKDEVTRLTGELAKAPKKTDLDKAVAKVAELEGKLKEAPTAAELKAAKDEAAQLTEAAKLAKNVLKRSVTTKTHNVKDVTVLVTDGAQLVAGGKGGTVIVLSDTPKTLAGFKGDVKIMAVQGNLVAAASGKDFTVWTMSDGKVVAAKAHTEEVKNLQITKEGKLVINGEAQKQPDLPALPAFLKKEWGVEGTVAAYAPTQRRLAVATADAVIVRDLPAWIVDADVTTK